MDRSEFKDHLISAGWSESEAESEASSIYDNPRPGDAQDCDGDLFQHGGGA